MPREIEIFGLYAPTLLLVYIGAGLLQWLIDGLLGRLGVFSQVWHPPLFRLSLFVCLFGCASLLVYR